jgi:hypothetical protein
MFRDFDSDRRHINQLSRLMPSGWHVVQRCLTMNTLAYPMHLNVIRMFDCLQCMSGVPRLTARLLPALFALAMWFGLLRPITGRRLVAVVAILGLLVFQCPYPGFKVSDQLSLLVEHLLLLLENGEQSTCQLLYQTDNAFFAQNVRGVYLFAGWQREPDHADIVPGLYDFSQSKSCFV